MGVRKASSKKLSTEREEGASFFIFRIHFYAGIVMVEYKEICGSTSTICKVVKKEKEVMKKKEKEELKKGKKKKKHKHKD